MSVDNNPVDAARASIRTSPRLIAFYLPQFHPTSFNDQHWGRGFTEWTNATKAKPRFPGHYQPHLPADLGFYDLRLPEARQAQALLAKEHGIYGFCYYHYWSMGSRQLERPLNEVIALKEPQFPFCICWANENWTRAWDGKDREVLIKQEYSDEDDLSHIRYLCSLFRDERYIRIESKPFVLIYRAESLPKPKQTAATWRSEARKAGIGEIFLANVESSFATVAWDPTTFGFDAAVSFEPIGRNFQKPLLNRLLRRLFSPSGRVGVFPYRELHRFWKTKVEPSYRRFDCIVPSWDNSARRNQGAFILSDSTPLLYEAWLRDAVDRTQPDSEGNRWLFINAWNEWGEGCHLEPCQKWGRAYLESTSRVVNSASHNRL